MYTHAIEEVQAILHQIDTDRRLPLNQQRDKLIYVCAMFAELAYHHVPEAEIGSKKRAKLISSEAYKQILKRKMASSVDITAYLIRQENEGELPQSFVVTTAQVVAIGYILGKRLFIAFRGTKFTLGYDWKANVKAEKVPLDSELPSGKIWALRPNLGLFHKGFLREACEISMLINDELQKRGIGDFNEVYLTGHSLGGAIAALSKYFLEVGNIRHIFVYGAPRSSNVLGVCSHFHRPAVQVRHAGDIVPTLPPLCFKYVDYPIELDTKGRRYHDPRAFEWPLLWIFRWVWCLVGLGRSHYMEVYRKELGVTAGAVGAKLDLVPMKRLTNDQLR